MKLTCQSQEAICTAKAIGIPESQQGPTLDAKVATPTLEFTRMECFARELP
jgi:hypothetical protein